jgi:ribonuclease Z
MLASSFRVHELLFQEDKANTDEPFLREEGSRDIRIDDGNWSQISTDDGCSVSAVPILHSVPSLGYVISEDDSITIPREYVEKVKQAFAGRTSELQNAWKSLKNGDAVKFDDGSLAKLPKQKGRQVVILGDTCDASTVLPYISKPVSLVLHEATNAYLPSYGKEEETLISVRTRAIDRGHSTPEMAGEFARKCDSQILVLTHFSSRYSGADNFGAVKIMKYFEKIASLAGTATQENVTAMFEDPKGAHLKKQKKNDQDAFNGKVVAAWDGMFIDIPKTNIYTSPDDEI